MTTKSSQTLCVVGLGYVGLPLAVEFGKTQHPTYGYDISKEKIALLKKGCDPNKELSKQELKETKLIYSADPQIISKADIIIAAIPTPIDSAKNPDLRPIQGASKTIGENLKKGAIIVFESTVYPGLTEEICVPILEQYSGLKLGKDFEIGYSPERINPGDKEHTLKKTIKIVSGRTPQILKILSALYREVVKAGVYEAPSIKVAEAAKVIENIQRDLNIGLVNELSIIFRRLGIDALEVLKAAETKWNFHSYRPGLVGGHCIGVDPYYLTHKAEKTGYHPQIILAGRRVNDGMAVQVVDGLIKELIKTGRPLLNNKILILGVTFKENVADMRNSKAQEIITLLKNYGLSVEAYDPLVDAVSLEKIFGVKPIGKVNSNVKYDAFILFSPHEKILQNIAAILKMGKNPAVFYDIKSKLKGNFIGKSSILYQTL